MYAWRKSCGFTLWTILVFIAVVVSPSAIPAVENAASTNPRRTAANPPTERTISTTPHVPRTPSLHRIAPGAHVSVSQGWIITVRALTSLLLPVQPASALLESFLHRALVHLSTNLLRNRPPPGNAVEISLGALTLALRAADPAHYLTWEACEIVVVKLLDDARMGFTGQFRSEWFHPASGALLHVSLEVVQRGVGAGFD